MASEHGEIKCQHSKIVVPGDPAYAEIAAAYAGSVAEKLGFGDSDAEDIRQSTERVVAWAIGYSLAENEKASVEVSCEIIPEGFKVTVNDRGVPFEPAGLKDAESKDLSGFFHIDARMDEILFNNLGPAGKEIILIKYSRRGQVADLHDACELELSGADPAPEPVRSRDVEFLVRPMRPEEAIEVSKCVYKGYGYTYPHEHIYYPAKLAELNENGSMFSAVAVSELGEIVGHCALLYENSHDRVAEMGLGVVAPAFRSRGCFNRLTELLIEKAYTDKLNGLYVHAVTLHEYSQRAAARFALKESALLLACIPPSVDFRRVENGRSQRVAVLLCYRFLRTPPQPAIFAPAGHERMIIDLYANLGIRPAVKSPSAPHEIAWDAESVVRIKVVNSMTYARIVIEKFTENIVREISRNVSELRANGIEVMNLYMDLSDPKTGWLSEEMEALGFFFAGIMPGGMPNGADALIFQYLNNIVIDYDAVRAHSGMAKALLEYVSRRGAAPGRRETRHPADDCARSGMRGSR